MTTGHTTQPQPPADDHAELMRKVCQVNHESETDPRRPH